MSETITKEEAIQRVQEGQEALQLGNAHEARMLFRQATEQDPSLAAAWVGMADSVLPYKDKHDYLSRALSLEPDNTNIREKLQTVEAEIAAGKILAPPITKDILGNTEPVSLQENAIIEVCYRHPDRETGLRCTQCGNPICTECTRPALVGQLCPDCARERRPSNYQVSAGMIALAAAVSFAVALPVSYLVVVFFRGFLFLILALFLAPAASNVLVRLLDRLTHAKRGRAMQIAVGAGLGVGAAPLLLLTLSLPLLLFFILAIVTAVNQLR